jgi:catechol 2,3-dioxygenase-like lactoylglutathione lyase family enzyme
MAGQVTVERLEHVGIVVQDLADAVAFFVELGLEPQLEAPAEGDWVDRIVELAQQIR